MEKTHELKTWPDMFDATMDGSKDFEFRKRDRDFMVGDILILREWDPATADYTGRKLHRIITYIFEGKFGMPDGYCILGLKI